MNASKNLIPFTNLLEGWQKRLDSAKSAGLQKMRNVILSDRGGVSVRSGSELFGASGSSNPITSGHTAIRRNGTNIMLRAYSTFLEYYNPDTSTWATLKSGFTADQTFGFADHNINTDQVDYVYFGNAVEPYQRWTMAYDKTTSSVSSAATSIPIQSTLLEDVFFSGTATSVSTTAITVAANTWANNIWDTGFYVRITDGAAQGQIRDITATTSNSITFSTIAGLTGTPTFQIRKLKFSSTTPTLVYGSGSTIAVTSITQDNGVSVVSAPALASGAPIAESPQELITNSCPRGNILKVLFQQMYVSGVKASPSTVYRSKLNDASNFTIAATRVAGDGDAVEFPSDGPIYDIEVYESSLAVFTESTVHQLTYTQDATDLAQKQPLVKSPYIGTKGRVNRMMNDIAFVNPSKEVTTLSRVPFRDTRPLPSNIAWPIKTAMRLYGTDEARIINYRNYMMVALKDTTSSETNDKVIVYDNVYEKWIGEWDIPVADFTTYNNDLYYFSSASNEAYKMLTSRTAQVKGSTVIGYDTEVETNWVNRTQTGINNQFFTMITFRGWIKENTPITFSLYYDFSVEPTHSWVFDPASASQDIILGNTVENVMGVTPLGITPLSVEVGQETSEFGEKPFFVCYKVPMTIHQFVKLGWTTSNADAFYDITDIQANFTEYTEPVPDKRKLAIDES